MNVLPQGDVSQVDKDIRWADAFLVVYSITDKKSFNNAIQLVEAIYDGKGTDELHVALVGNKKDLEHFRKGISFKKVDVAGHQRERKRGHFGRNSNPISSSQKRLRVILYNTNINDSSDAYDEIRVWIFKTDHPAPKQKSNCLKLS